MAENNRLEVENDIDGLYALICKLRYDYLEPNAKVVDVSTMVKLMSKEDLFLEYKILQKAVLEYCDSLTFLGFEVDKLVKGEISSSELREEINNIRSRLIHVANFTMKPR